MAYSPDKGRIIPANPSPDGLNCLLVFYPDDDIYLYSLMGALTEFGTWLAWEKDGTTRAKQAAYAWKIANEATMANCLEDLVTALAGIQTAIENKESICAPIINVDSCCYGADVPPIPPDEDGIDPLPDPTVYDPNSGESTPPDGYNDWHEYLNAKCQGANYIADEVISLAANFATLGSLLTILSTQNLITQLSMMIPGGWLVALGGWVLTNLVINLIQIHEDDGLTVFTQFSDALAANKEELVCKLYSWLSVEDGLGTVHNFIQSIIEPLPISSTSKTILSAFWLAMLSSRFFNWYADNLQKLVPEGYTGTVDCASCGGCGLIREMINGTGNIYGTGNRTLTAEYILAEGNDRYMLDFSLEDNYCLGLTLNGFTPATMYGRNAYEISRCINGELTLHETSGDSSPPNSICANKVVLTSSTPFTAGLDIIEISPDCQCYPPSNWIDFSVNPDYTLPDGWAIIDPIITLMNDSDIDELGGNNCADFNWCFGIDAAKGAGSNSGKLEFAVFSVSSGTYRLEVDYMRHATSSNNPPRLDVIDESTQGVIYSESAVQVASRDGIIHSHQYTYDFTSSKQYRVQIVIQGHIVSRLQMVSV